MKRLVFSKKKNIEGFEKRERSEMAETKPMKPKKKMPAKKKC